MNVLVINGSPKDGNSNTYRLTAAFLEGIKQEFQDMQTKELSVGSMEIKPCLGCFSCWNRTPGQCCIQDDMQRVIGELLWADITIWSFPLYYYSVPGSLKNLIDRQLPMLLPFMDQKEGQVGSGSHPSRYDMSGKRTVVISTCGFYTAEGNYDGIYSLFDHLCGRESYTAVFSGQGELFRVPELSARTNEYLSCVKQAGREFIKGGISKETQEALRQLLLPRETFEACADASWGIAPDDGRNSYVANQQSDTLIFTTQMAALYRKENYPGQDIVLEMDYTDVGECYQILLGKDGSRVYTDGSLTATTRIETPVTVWRSIAAGEIRGDDAMMQGLYKVKGDFSLMLKWDSYFGGSRPQVKQAEKVSTQSDANMNIMLIPWIVLWIAPAIHKQWGCLITLGVCAVVPLLYYRNRKTFYDILTNALVTGISIIMLAGGSEKWLLPLSYLFFGVMWALSCLGKVPLTANYSMNDYGGEDALQNALFLKTNRILTMLWGVLYLFTSIFTWFLMRTSISSFVGLINSIVPIFMGIFTAWFQNWYPAKVAAGK
ncbi:MAG: NAD(P)H-dependent oxidoreductase [Lachnospiraceae bacterium]|nr:NAD(P)H-dependent oxidoreductase [Lachnospiraceae bacterium]